MRRIGNISLPDNPSALEEQGEEWEISEREMFWFFLLVPSGIAMLYEILGFMGLIRW